MYQNPIDVLVYGIENEKQTSNNISLLVWGMVILSVIFTSTYAIGKYYQKTYHLSTWAKGFEKFIEKIMDKKSSLEAPVLAMLLQYSENVSLSDLFTCFYRPFFVCSIIDNGIAYYQYEFAGIKPEYRNRSKCMLIVINTVRRFFQEVRGFDCGSVYIKTLTQTELCFGIAVNQYGVKQLASLLEVQQHKLQTEMAKITP